MSLMSWDVYLDKTLKKRKKLLTKRSEKGFLKMKGLRNSCHLYMYKSEPDDVEVYVTYLKYTHFFHIKIPQKCVMKYEKEEKWLIVPK